MSLQSIGGRVALGATFFLGARLSVRLLAIVNIAVLGRLLTPDDFGIMALAIVVIGLNEAVQNRQFEFGLIQMENPERAHFDTAFTMALSLGALMAFGVVAAAAPLARLMDAPALEQALYWLALAPILDGLRNPYFARFEKALRFGPAAMVEAASRLCLTLVAVGLGFLWRDYWAMVAGMLALSAARTAMTYAMADALPRPGLSRWRDFVRFGGWLSGSGALGFLDARISTAAVGAQFSNAVVGVFHVGSDMVAMATTALAQPFVNAIYPGLVTVSAEPDRLRRGYLKAQTMMLALFLPIGVGIALTAPEIVTVLIGTKWLDAVPVLQWLGPALAVATVATPVYAVTMARDDTRAHVGIAVSGLAAQLPALVACVWAFGFMGAVYARAFSLLVRSAVALRYGARATGDVAAAPLRASWRSVAAAAAMAGAVLALRSGLPPSDGFLAAAINLAALAATGAASYGAAHAILWLAAGRPDGIERMAMDMARGALGRLRARRS